MPPKRKPPANPAPGPNPKKKLKFPASDPETSPSSSSSEEDAPPSPSPPPASSDDDADLEWEDVLAPAPAPAPAPSGDLELTLDRRRVPPADGPMSRRGASAAARRVRLVTHCVHVQLLVFAGAVRNWWVRDATVRGTLMSLVPAGVAREVERYWERVGKGKGMEDAALVRALGVLMHWWKKRFRVTAPGLRKHGYKPLWVFENERTAEGRKVLFPTGRRGPDGEEMFTPFLDTGETVRGLAEMRELAGRAEGSRDVGALLFTGLCRALGFEARVVFSLQPLGFGFSSAEEDDGKSGATPKKAQPSPVKTPKGKKRKAQSESESDSESELTELSSESDEDTESHSTRVQYDKDLLYPTFWTEVLSPTTNDWIAIDPLVLTILGADESVYARFEPKGAKAAAAKQVIAYVVAYSADGTAKDVTTRYLAKHALPGKTKGFRVPSRDVPIYALDNTVVGTQRVDWFAKVMRGYQRPEHKRTEADKAEDEELAAHIEKARETPKKAFTESISGYKNYPDLVLERHLRREEAVKRGKKHVKTLTVGKGDAAKEEKIYRREDIVVCKAVENWHREGRNIKMGEQPLKMVKRRAVTLNRKREIEDREREGETVMQGLYSIDQTELYIPPPIENGFIPRNEFGNIDIYVPSMIPRGAVHLPLKGSARIAKKLNISFADAVTGFEFKKQRAVPYIDGIVVAEENADVVRDAWREEERIKREKEDAKKIERALERWRKFVVRLRVLKRLREEYADEGKEMDEEANPFARRDRKKAEVEKTAEERGEDEMRRGEEEEGGFLKEGWDQGDMAGGFLPEDGMAGGFLPEETGGGFILEEDPQEEERTKTRAAKVSTKVTSLQSLYEASAQPKAGSDSGAGSDIEEQIEKGDEAVEEDEEIRSEYFINKPPTKRSSLLRELQSPRAPRTPAKPGSAETGDAETGTMRRTRRAATTTTTKTASARKITEGKPRLATATAASSRPRRQAATSARAAARQLLQEEAEAQDEDESEAGEGTYEQEAEDEEEEL